MKKILTIVCFFIATITSYAQNKLHFDLDYNYNLGLSMHTKYASIKRSEYKMGGHALHFAARYDVMSRLSVGAGVGLNLYTTPDFNVLPIYATLRYKPFRKTLKPYVFSDLGYCVGDNDKFRNGFTSRWGIGYTHMFRKHFGMNFQLGYNLEAIHDTYLIWTENDVYNVKGTTKRHSITLGVGLTF